jgi:hypothetical protein
MHVILQTWCQIQRISFSLRCVNLRSRPYRMQLQFCIFKLQYSTKGFCAAIGDIATIQWALYCNRGAKYCACSPVYAVNCRPGHIQCNYCYVYSGFNIQVIQSALLLEISRYLDAPYTENLVSNTAHILHFTLWELWPRDIQCNNSSAYSGFNIQVKVSALILDIYRQFNVRYTAHMVPNTAHILQFTRFELWSRTYKM